ncbi:MAG: LysR substrate-binding domain-containing protein [Burkholderiales bacterium]
MPAWLRRLEARTPIGPIQLVSDVLQHCETLMQQGRVQFLLCHAHDTVPGRLEAASYPSLKVGVDALMPVAAPDAAGRPRHTLKRDAMASVPVLAYSAESGLGRLVRALRGDMLAGARVDTVFTAHLASVLRTMALQGKGIAWLPRSLIEDDLQARRLVEAGDASWRVELDIRLFRRAGTEPPAAEALWAAAAAG